MVFRRFFMALAGIALAMTAARAMTLDDSTAKAPVAANTAGPATGAGHDFDIRLGEGGRIGVQFGSVTLDLAGDYLNGGAGYQGSNDRRSAATIDFYPWGDGFRLSLGARVNTHAMHFSAQPSGMMPLGAAGLDVGGVAALGANSSAAMVSPYLGIGYSRPLLGNLPVSFDLGVLYQGDQLVSSGTMGGLSGLQTELSAENQHARSDLFNSQLDPVAMISIDYRF